MKATVRWRQALERIEELHEIEEQGTPAPWMAYHHSWSTPAAGHDGALVGVRGRDQVTGGGVLEDPDLAVPDAVLIMMARNLLPGLLDAAQAVLRVHEPAVDPDGEPICRHCVRAEPTHLWPCGAVVDVLAAIEGGDGS